MKFLANENIPLKSIEVLRKKGFDVKSVSELFPGISDKEVLTFAKKEQRIILTFDKDYGYLLYKEGIAFKKRYYIVQALNAFEMKVSRMLK
ncbi:MAG: DUF5615 family PIN-like protein [Bacillota bacterium]